MKKITMIALLLISQNIFAEPTTLKCSSQVTCRSSCAMTPHQKEFYQERGNYSTESFFTLQDTELDGIKAYCFYYPPFPQPRVRYPIYMTYGVAEYDPTQWHNGIGGKRVCRGQSCLLKRITTR